MYKTNVTTEYREQLKGRILQSAMHEFRTNGIKQVKMDDIARKLSISKRTLYEIYGNKEDLLMEGIKRDEEIFNRHMEMFITEHHGTLMDIFAEYFRYELEQFKYTSLNFFIDLQRYPRVLTYLDELHKARNRKGVSFFNRGVEEGYFRQDVDYELVEQVCSASMRHVMDNQLFHKYSMQHILYNVVFLFMRGLCTEQGLHVLEEKLKLFK